MKKIIAVILCFICLSGLGINAGAESLSELQQSTTCAPTTCAPWMLIESINITFFVSQNGRANVTYNVTANSDQIDVTVYVEKKNKLLGWTQVGDAENLKTEKRYINGTYSVPVSSEGEYRAVIIVVPAESKYETAKRTAGFTYDKTGFVGDVNSDGVVNAIDARLALRFAARLEKYTDAQKKLCDVNGDRKITSADARHILRISAKLD